MFPASTSETYGAFAKSKGIKTEIVEIEDTVGCWTGNKNADIVVVWFHGMYAVIRIDEIMANDTEAAVMH